MNNSDAALPTITLRPMDVDNSADVEAFYAVLAEIDALLTPEIPVTSRADFELWARYGWELNPEHRWLIVDHHQEVVGIVTADLPTWDNPRLAWCDMHILPERRGEGLAQSALGEFEQLMAEQGRTVLAMVDDDDPDTQTWWEAQGYQLKAFEPIRAHFLSEIDWERVRQLSAEALPQAVDYVFERVCEPLDAAGLAEVAEVEKSLNDSPMGQLDFEPEVFTPERMAAIETSLQHRKMRLYRSQARHRETGELVGTSYVLIMPGTPTWALQGTTGVKRDHRGHRLGLLLKTEMLEWLREAEPQVEVITTENDSENSPMLAINEQLGYRLIRNRAVFEKKLTDTSEAGTS